MQTFDRAILMAVLVVSVAFALLMIGLSIRANTRYRQERELPMQWRLSRSEPLAQSVNWSAPRVVALSFTPSLAIGALVLLNIAAVTLTPRPGQEGMLLPSLIFIGGVFVAAHILHLWLIEKTLRPSGG